MNTILLTTAVQSYNSDYDAARIASIAVMVPVDGVHVNPGALTLSDLDAYSVTERLSVGPSQGADQSRGADQWWHLYFDGHEVGELRDDGAGLTIFFLDTFPGIKIEVTVLRD